MESVYIETTIPSFYFETRTTPIVRAWKDVTRRWWERKSTYALYTSRFVHAELRQSPLKKASDAIKLIEAVPVLEAPADMERVIARYIREKLVPAEAGGDAAHLAIASFDGIDFLLTWNCRHLANANKVRHIAAVNKKLGLHVPTVVTPLTLLGEEAP